MAGHLRSLIPGDGPEQLAGQRGDGHLHGRVHLLRRSAVGKVEQQHVAGAALDQRADRRSSGLPDDQVALPVARNGPISHLCGAITDHHHVGVVTPCLDAALGPSGDPARPQAAHQLPAELTPALDEEVPIDRLVAHPHHRIVWIVRTQAESDLLGRPPLLEPGRDLGGQSGTRELEGLRALGTGSRSFLALPCPVVAPAPVGLHLAGHRGHRLSQLAGDQREGLAPPQTEADLLTVGQGQAPRPRNPVVDEGPARRVDPADTPDLLRGTPPSADLLHAGRTLRISASVPGCDRLWSSPYGPPRSSTAASLTHRVIARTS